MNPLSKLMDIKFVLAVAIVALVVVAMVNRNTFGIGNLVAAPSTSK